jgi:hypothetical protein
MANCPFCNHFNRTDATQCEQCKAPLQTTIRGESDSPPPESAEGPLPGNLETEILDLMRGHKKIEAIKIYREHTKVGLKEAKDFVESLAAKHGVAPGAGCGGMVLLMILTGAAMAGAAWTLVMS